MGSKKNLAGHQGVETALSAEGSACRTFLEEISLSLKEKNLLQPWGHLPSPQTSLLPDQSASSPPRPHLVSHQQLKDIREKAGNLKLENRTKSLRATGNHFSPLPAPHPHPHPHTPVIGNGLPDKSPKGLHSHKPNFHLMTEFKDHRPARRTSLEASSPACPAHTEITLE